MNFAFYKSILALLKVIVEFLKKEEWWIPIVMIVFGSLSIIWALKKFLIFGIHDSHTQLFIGAFFSIVGAIILISIVLSRRKQKWEKRAQEFWPEQNERKRVADVEYLNEELKEEIINWRGLKFRLRYIERPNPSSGPNDKAYITESLSLCPKCQRELRRAILKDKKAYKFYRLEVKYECECGFKITINKTPFELYQEIWNNYHIYPKEIEEYISITIKPKRLSNSLE